MFNSAIFSIHGMDSHTTVHLEGSSWEKVQNPKEPPGHVSAERSETQLIVFLIALIMEIYVEN